MSGDNKNIIYTSKHIEAYFSGRLSSASMHQMEKDSLDDPLLAEAMEGYKAMRGGSWKLQLTELHRHFEEKRSPAKVIAFHRTTGRWWKVAAAILVIGCGATLTYLFNTKNYTGSGKEEIAKNATPAARPAIISKFDSTTPIATISTPIVPDHVVPVTNGKLPQPASAVSNNSLALAEKKPVTEQTFNKLIYPPAQTPADSKEKTTTSIVINEKDKDVGRPADKIAVVPATNNSNPINTNSNTIASNAINGGSPGKAAEDFAKRKTVEKQATVSTLPSLTHSFTAQVVGPDNTPLPFANVNLKNEDFGTYADVKGNFRLVSSDSLINVEVKSVGYLPRVYTLHSNSLQNRIVLAEDENTAKENAVVINNGIPASRSARRAGVLKDSMYVNVEPADGWDNYNAYLRNNINIPDNALKKDIHGEVELSFKVHPNGTVSDITVNQSDCAYCSELAKRLVEQGPQWKIKKGIRRSSARIKLQF